MSDTETEATITYAAGREVGIADRQAGRRQHDHRVIGIPDQWGYTPGMLADTDAEIAENDWWLGYWAGWNAARASLE